MVERGADASHAMDLAHRGLAGDLEDETTEVRNSEEPGDVYDLATQRNVRRLDRKGYRENVELLRSLGVEE